MTNINDFNSFVKKGITLLKELREKAREMISTREVLNQNYKNLTTMLTQYEDNNLNQYVDAMPNR